MRLAALLMAALMLTAGCLGFGGDESGDAAEDPADDAEGPADEQNAGEEETDGEEGEEASEEGEGQAEEAEPEPNWDNRTGEVEGPNLVVESQGETEETITVEEAALEFAVNMTAQEGAIDAWLYPPECEETGCAHEMSSSDGESALWSTDEPAPGEWRLVMQKANPGVDSVPYEVAFFQLLEV